MNDRELINLAYEASHNAYAPYSGFSVGAALECMDGTVFTAATWKMPLRCCICAEDCARQGGERGKREFTSSPYFADTNKYCLPAATPRCCMSFRRKSRSLLKSSGAYVSYKLSQLLPKRVFLERTIGGSAKGTRREARVLSHGRTSPQFPENVAGVRPRFRRHSKNRRRFPVLKARPQRSAKDGGSGSTRRGFSVSPVR